MSDRIDLSDPSFEPTDEQLAGLMSRAFAHLPAAEERRMANLRAEIARKREEVLRSLQLPERPEP